MTRGIGQEHLVPCYLDLIEAWTLYRPHNIMLAGFLDLMFHFSRYKAKTI